MIDEGGGGGGGGTARTRSAALTTWSLRKYVGAILHFNLSNE